jgi:hypothetical protein
MATRLTATCVNCHRALPPEMFVYTHLAPANKCRTCKAHKGKNPTLNEINHYETTLRTIIAEGKQKFPLEEERILFDEYVHKMVKTRLPGWRSPIWINRKIFK